MRFVGKYRRMVGTYSDNGILTLVRWNRSRMAEACDRIEERTIKIAMGVLVEEAVRRGLNYGDGPTPNTLFPMGGAQ